MPGPRAVLVVDPRKPALLPRCPIVATAAVGGYTNIPVTFTGSMSTTGLISGTIQIALPSGPVKYTLTPKG